MIGILLVTHGHLAREMAQTVEHVLGKQEHFSTIGVDSDQDLQDKKEEIMNAIAQVRTAKGVIVGTDLYGSTPSNLASSFCKEKCVQLICGVNVPLLIQLMQLRQIYDLQETVRRAIASGQKYMQRAEDFSR